MKCNGCKRRVGAVLSTDDDDVGVRTLALTVCGKPGLDDDEGCFTVGRSALWWCEQCLIDGLCPDCDARRRSAREAQQRELFGGETHESRERHFRHR